MVTCKVLAKFIQKRPNWKTATEIELPFQMYEKRTLKIFLDRLYGLEPVNLDIEDFIKLLLLVDEIGTDEETDFNGKNINFI